ncbi:5-carboxymethyl-2-hydroxymuconate isomerase [Marinomonas sp. TI.3.20]|uniref:5-carboxymethyl-2-hydroxymuconate Delta-isomerase n=1 Tax=Marinomonas sp. TI.3.20 TaxID=3121296 RepID=UPI00311F17E7
MVPHCVIEHSSNIDGNSLTSRVFSGAMDSKLFEENGSDIKVRAISFSNYQTGNDKASFVHVALKLLSGRNSEQKLNFSTLFLEHLKTLGLSGCSITVEVIDIDRNSYSKVLM